MTYFTSTIAYMMAYAIYIGVEEIILWDILSGDENSEYMQQKACLDFWCGVAIGRGITIVKTPESKILEPVGGQHNLYGYKPSMDNFVTKLMKAGLEPVL